VHILVDESQRRPTESRWLAEAGFTGDPAGLGRLAEAGWEEAKHAVVGGLAEGKYGFIRDHHALRKLADRGWRRARFRVLDGLAEGKYGFTQDLAESRRLAEGGWVEEQHWVVAGLAEGKYGFTRDHDALRKLAEAGGRDAQRFVAKGLAKGWYGFRRDLAGLGRLAGAGWEEAKDAFVDALAQDEHGDIDYGSPRNHDALRKLADRGWRGAQCYVAFRLVDDGCRGGLSELRRLAFDDYRSHHNLDNPYVFSYFEAAPLAEKAAFLRALPDLGRSALGWAWMEGIAAISR
jgi:hypothetical protein